MILPIVAFGDPVLRKKCKDVSADYPEIDILIDNMWQTMYEAHGVGLAAPQINKDIRLFLVDTTPFVNDDEMEKPFKQIFINPRIIERKGEKVDFNEGCLSIPDVREDIERESTIIIKYQDENFRTHTSEYNGIIARVVQHEYDHIEGVLFTDRISPLRKKMIRGKLMDIAKGKIKTSYKMKFVK